MLSVALMTASDLTLWKGRATEGFASEEYRVEPFDRAVLSWNATGTAIFELEADGVWNVMGRWGDKPQGVQTDAVRVDTLVLKRPARSFRFRLAMEKGAAVTLVAVAHWKHGDRRLLSEKPSAAWGQVLDVPRRSQIVEAKDAGEICSPTSVAMLLEFYGVKKTTREVADGVFDHAQKIYGNWPFNTAFAHAALGREAFVARFGGLEELETEIAAGRPVIISHRWRKGDLDGAPVETSNGHLIVVVGFTREGDVVVNDPAANPGSVRRTYPRRQIYSTWLERASGIAYVVREPVK